MMNTSLYRLIKSRFPSDRRRPFLHGPDFASFSYEDLDRLSSLLAERLRRHGAVRGDRILVQVQKTPMAIFLYLACLRAGFVYLPINPAYRDNEVRYIIDDAKPAVVISDPELPACNIIGTEIGARAVLTLDAKGGGSLTSNLHDHPAQEIDMDMGGDDLAAVLYTSGTTGRPKGAMLSHRNLASNALTLHRAWDFREGDVLLHALPIFHTHGLFVATNVTLMNGGQMMFLPRFDVDDVIRALPSCTVMMGVPTFYTRLLSSAKFGGTSCSSIRLFISGSAPLSGETFRAFEERTGHRILERYGMTETNMIASNPWQGERVAGSVGPALPGVEVRISDEDHRVLPCDQVGSIEVRGPNVFKGYWAQSEQTADQFTEDGFFITGDLGVMNARGYLTIVGRSTDLIISGGLNVYPKEVEAVLEGIPGVSEIAVIGVPHPDFGEGVVAVAVRDMPIAVVPTEPDLMAHAKRQLAPFKVPKAVIFCDRLPRNSMGKVQKSELRAQFSGIFDGSAAYDG